MIDPIPRTKLKDQVMTRLLDMITSRNLGSGGSLPPERELVERLGVSRTVVREALNVLEAQGIIRIEHGRGSVVTAPNGQAVGNSLKLLLRIQPDTIWDLLEMRKILEVEIAGLAAERNTAEDVRKMRAALDKMHANFDAPEGYVDADVEFHNLLATSTGNQVLPMMIESIGDLMRLSRRMTASSGPTSVRRALREHEAILQKVQARDAAGARLEMQKHLRAGEQDLRRAIKKQNQLTS